MCIQGCISGDTGVMLADRQTDSVDSDGKVKARTGRDEVAKSPR